MAKVKSRRPGPYVQQHNGVEMSEELRRQSDIQMGQLIQEVKGIGATLTTMQTGMATMQTDIKALQAHMHTSKGYFSGLSFGLRNGIRLTLLVVAVGVGAAGREIAGLVSGMFK